MIKSCREIGVTDRDEIAFVQLLVNSTIAGRKTNIGPEPVKGATYTVARGIGTDGTEKSVRYVNPKELFRFMATAISKYQRDIYSYLLVVKKEDIHKMYEENIIRDFKHMKEYLTEKTKTTPYGPLEVRLVDSLAARESMAYPGTDMSLTKRGFVDVMYTLFNGKLQSQGTMFDSIYSTSGQQTKADLDKKQAEIDKKQKEEAEKQKQEAARQESERQKKAAEEQIQKRAKEEAEKKKRAEEEAEKKKREEDRKRLEDIKQKMAQKGAPTADLEKQKREAEEKIKEDERREKEKRDLAEKTKREQDEKKRLEEEEEAIEKKRQQELEAAKQKRFEEVTKRAAEEKLAKLASEKKAAEESAAEKERIRKAEEEKQRKAEEEKQRKAEEEKAKQALLNVKKEPTPSQISPDVLDHDMRVLIDAIDPKQPLAEDPKAVLLTIIKEGYDGFNGVIASTAGAKVLAKDRDQTISRMSQDTFLQTLASYAEGPSNNYRTDPKAKATQESIIKIGNIISGMVKKGEKIGSKKTLDWQNPERFKYFIKVLLLTVANKTNALKDIPYYDFSILAQPKTGSHLRTRTEEPDILIPEDEAIEVGEEEEIGAGEETSTLAEDESRRLINDIEVLPELVASSSDIEVGSALDKIHREFENVISNNIASHETNGTMVLEALNQTRNSLMSLNVNPITKEGALENVQKMIDQLEAE